MKPCNIIRSQSYGGIQKGLLYTSFIRTGVVVSHLMAWFYDKIQLGIGTEVAQVGLATGVVVMLLTITSGVKIGRSVDRVILRQESIFSTPVKESWPGS
jgi:hypothetical protein